MPKRCTRCQKELTSGQIICLECANELKAKPTLDECIKEWEERGWIFVPLYNDNKIVFATIAEKTNILGASYIQIDVTDKGLFIKGYINSNLLDLATKTLKALEVENG